VAQQYLFVYGTLHPDRAPDEIKEVVHQLILIGKGTVAGEVHDLGDYPALVLTGKRNQRADGFVFALPEDPDLLPALDGYEGFLPDDPTNSLFIRRKRTVTLDGGSRKRCWVYLYRGLTSRPELP
jgi:gamma-glutamylcyclotransferase (GGCT)/AIG2-like uncharacterized protein YtfP